MPETDSRISPTAHYTSYVWVRNGLSHPVLASTLGRWLYRTLWPGNAAYALFGRANLETMLLARHREIDRILEGAIAAGEVRQVIEIAAGFSARGWRMMERHRSHGLKYVEGDLAPQAAEKRQILDGARLRRAGHEVLPLDALIDSGAESLAEIASAHLDPASGCAIITEGLLGYFDRETVMAMWRRIAGVLKKFPRGIYLSDINVAEDLRGLRAVEAFRVLLQAFARGRIHMHFQTAAELESTLRESGFSTVKLHRPGGHLVRVIEARP